MIRVTYSIVVFFLCCSALAQSEEAPPEVQKFWARKVAKGELFGLPDPRWHLLYLDEEMLVLIDNKTIEHMAAMYTVWVRTYYAKAVVLPSGHGRGDHSVDHQEVDCDGRRFRVLTTALFDHNGRPLLAQPPDGSEFEDPAWHVWMPGTVAERMYTYACEDMPQLIQNQ